MKQSNLVGFVEQGVAGIQFPVAVQAAANGRLLSALRRYGVPPAARLLLKYEPGHGRKA
jgi:hypothetical protein